MIKHKAEEKGVNVICHEESYTSGCSFPDNESTDHHETTKEQEHQEEYS
jgi:transposase